MANALAIQRWEPVSQTSDELLAFERDVRFRPKFTPEEHRALELHVLERRPIREALLEAGARWKGTPSAFMNRPGIKRYVAVLLECAKRKTKTSFEWRAGFLRDTAIEAKAKADFGSAVAAIRELNVMMQRADAPRVRLKNFDAADPQAAADQVLAAMARGDLDTELAKDLLEAVRRSSEVRANVNGGKFSRSLIVINTGTRETPLVLESRGSESLLPSPEKATA